MRRLLSVLLVACVVATVLPAIAAAQVYVYQSNFAVSGSPWSILPHSNGETWVATNTGIRRYSGAGALLGTVATYGCTGLAEASNGDVFAADYYGVRIVRYTAGGSLVHQWPTGGTRMVRLAVDATDQVYAVRFSSGFSVSALDKYSPAGTLLGSVSGLPAMGGIACANGQLYLAPLGGGSLRTYSTALAPLATLPASGSALEETRADVYGQVWVADYGAGMVRVFSAAGTTIGTIGPSIAGLGGTISPEAVAVDAAGRIFVGDNNGQRVVVLTAGATPTAQGTWGRLKSLRH